MDYKVCLPVGLHNQHLFNDQFIFWALCQIPLLNHKYLAGCQVVSIVDNTKSTLFNFLDQPVCVMWVPSPNGHFEPLMKLMISRSMVTIAMKRCNVGSLFLRNG